MVIYFVSLIIVIKYDFNLKAFAVYGRIFKNKPIDRIFENIS